MTMVKREDVILNATENMVYHKLKMIQVAMTGFILLE